MPVRMVSARVPLRWGATNPMLSVFMICTATFWEWVQDCWNKDYRGAPTDGSAWTRTDCLRRVLRGGSWGNGPGTLRAAERDGFTTVRRDFFSGFRVARTLAP